LVQRHQGPAQIVRLRHRGTPSIDVSDEIAILAARPIASSSTATYRQRFRGFDPASDAIVFATPHSQHGPQVERAAAAGKPVFMEKPFTLDVASAERALDAAARAGIVLAVAYPRRFHPSVAELKGRIADGRLGVLSHCQSEQTAPAGLSMRADYWRSDPVEVPAGAMTATGDDAVAIARTAGFRMLVMSPHPSCGDCPLTASEPVKKSGQNIPKNRCRTTMAERMVENASGAALYRGSGRLPRTEEATGC